MDELRYFCVDEIWWCETVAERKGEIKRSPMAFHRIRKRIRKISFGNVR